MYLHFLALCLTMWSTQARAQTPPPASPPASPSPGPALDYDIAISHAPDILIANAPGTLRVVITPHAPWLLKTTTPFAITLQGPPSVDFKQAKFGARDFADAKASAKTVSTPLTPKEAGEQRVVVDMMFFLCSDQVCQRHKEVKEYVLPVTATP